MRYSSADELICAPVGLEPTVEEFQFLLAGKSEFPTPASASTPTQAATNTPGAFSTPAGPIGKSSSGVTYTCKTLTTDTRNRWRR